MNLCLNARDAMPEGGQLVIETGATMLKDEYVKEHPYMKEGRYAVLSVSDTGVGMDEETRGRIYEPFFTTKGPDQGTGLGLAVVYGIVKQHNGFIHVYSEPGKGTTFRVYFPEVDAPAEARLVMPHMAPPARGSETILLAEDEASVRDLMAQALKAYGYKVLVARDGAEAVDIFRQHDEDISGAEGPVLERLFRQCGPRILRFTARFFIPPETVRPGVAGRKGAGSQGFRWNSETPRSFWATPRAAFPPAPAGTSKHEQGFGERRSVVSEIGRFRNPGPAS